MAANKIEPVHVLANKQHQEFQMSARKLGDTLAAIEPLTKSLTKAANDKIEEQLNVASVHFDLFDNLEVTDEYLASLPVPGTIEGHVPDNKPYDIYFYKDLDGNKQRGSYWDGVRDRHPFIVACRKEIEAIDASADVAYQKKIDKADIQTKISTFNTKLRMAVALFFKMQEANEEMAGIVEVGYAERPVLDEHGKPVMETVEIGGKMMPQVKTEIHRKSPRLIIVRDLARRKEAVAEPFTIPNFLRLSVEYAKANGGTYAAFIKSNARGTPEEENPTVEAPKIDSPVAFESATATFVHFMNGAKQTHNAHLWKSLVAHYSAAGSDDRLMTLANLRDQLNIFLGLKEFKDRVDAMEMNTDVKSDGSRAKLTDAFKTGGVTGKAA